MIETGPKLGMIQWKRKPISWSWEKLKDLLKPLDFLRTFPFCHCQVASNCFSGKKVTNATDIGQGRQTEVDCCADIESHYLYYLTLFAQQAYLSHWPLVVFCTDIRKYVAGGLIGLKVRPTGSSISWISLWTTWTTWTTLVTLTTLINLTARTTRTTSTTLTWGIWNSESNWLDYRKDNLQKR